MGFRDLVAGLAVTVSVAAPLRAQHDMADMVMGDSATSMKHVMFQAIPLVTRASPTAGGATQTQLALTQVVLMARLGFLKNRAELDAALNGEGLTMPNGELNTGASGEGYVDKRHPHTYVHELVLSGKADAGSLSYSASAGRGFAPFGTDDPMMRPLDKYPLDHHLAQILERVVAMGAVRAGPVIVEGGTFNGDEPISPSSLPRFSRFGDSWSVRTTLLPVTGIELQGSYARVASPEQQDGFGLDQRKQSYSARAVSNDGDRYLLAEWERTVEHDHSRDADAFAYQAALIEGSMRAGPVGVALRLEQTERPEETRLADPFRTLRPPDDLSINGTTQWRVVTFQVDAPAVTQGGVSGVPFIEVARLASAARDPLALFTPERLYGTSRFWMFTVGMRLRIGGSHSRMGRYGVAVP